jgi:hypothetical protein
MTEKLYPNWNHNSTHTIWKHKMNPKVMVAILPNTTHPRLGKYLIFHSHPGPNGTAIVQDPEGALTMKSARERAERHLDHWAQHNLWSGDKDFGKMGRRAT